MNDWAKRALLPEGVRDTLPPLAETHDRVVGALLGHFRATGYEQVAPPLIEFEESLFSGTAGEAADQAFRVLDPSSHRMMAIRSDMTTQVARIATARLGAMPRPLRLCYAGPVLRVKGGQLRSERAFTQAGVELIGSETLAAEVEVMALAARALADVGIVDLTVDIALPRLSRLLAEAFKLDGKATAQLRAALDEKDAAALLGLPKADIFEGLLQAAGNAEDGLAKLSALSLPKAAKEMCQHAADLVSAVRAQLPDLHMTIDPGESRGFVYHTGFGFALFARGVRGELGRGGRYGIQGPDGMTEPACGFTIFVDNVLTALPEDDAAEKIYAPLGADPAVVQALRQDGWRVVSALDDTDANAEAKRLGCSHILDGKKPKSIG